MNAKSFLTKMERRLLETRAEEHPLTELAAGVLGARMERGGGGTDSLPGSSCLLSSHPSYISITCPKTCKCPVRVPSNQPQPGVGEARAP